MEFNIDEVIKKINKTLEEKGLSCEIEITKVKKPEWDFDHMQSVKEQLQEEALSNQINQLAKAMVMSGFTVISKERLNELRAKEKGFDIFCEGMSDLTQKVYKEIEVFNHD